MSFDIVGKAGNTSCHSYSQFLEYSKAHFVTSLKANEFLLNMNHSDELT